ncbi:MAG: hypothetical protein PHI23_01150 [Candidatus Peribacteraceae bacterium]|nr:hypothetical protein [Candidatus Peribacteraceae bacterium]
MRSSLCLSVLGILCLLPATVLAAPANVTGIQVEQRPEGILVSWDKPQEAEDIVSYRVYYGQESILETEGEYDDFEDTEGPVLELMLKNISPLPAELFVAVMAVDAEGEESPYFVEEASIHPAPVMAPVSSSPSATTQEEMNPFAEEEVSAPVITEGGAATSSSSSSKQMPTGGLSLVPAEGGKSTLKLLTTKATSRTSVLLTFSAPISIEPSSAASAFGITDPKGAVLAMLRLDIEGATAIITTSPQFAGTVYRVQLNDPLRGEEGEVLDATERSALFTGHESGEKETQATSSSSSSVPIAVSSSATGDIQDLTFEVTPQNNGNYTVSVRWQAPTSYTPSIYAIRQSRDGGKTFGAAQYLDGSLQGIQLKDVTPGEFGIGVNALDAQNNASPGVFRSVDLARSAALPASVIPGWTLQRNTSFTSVAPSTTPIRRPLSRTGEPVGLLCLAALGAAAGWRRMQGKKRAS